MPTPTKRRKRNDYVPSQQPVKSLDFFFGKQKKEQELISHREQLPEDGLSIATSPEQQELGSTLTDEDLARKLQEEWNSELQAGDSNDATTSTIERPPNAVHEEERSGSGEVMQSKTPTKPPVTSNFGGINTLSLQSVASTEDAVTTSIPFDEHPLTFDPSKYIPQLKEHWSEHGGSASYGLLTRAFFLINSTQSRIKIVDTLVNFLRTIIEGDPDSLLSAVSLSLQPYL